MRVLLTVLALVAVGLAGCTDSEPDDGFVPAEAEVITDPTAEANATDGAHIHDYWGGADELVIIDTPAGISCIGCVEISTRVTPEEGTVVPQGTARVEFVITWSDTLPSSYRDPELLVKSAGMNEPESLGFIPEGDVMVMETTLDDADLPHQILSGWELFIQVGEFDETTVNTASIQFHVTMRAFRGLELPVFPAHPDHWGDRTEIDLFSASQTTANVYVGGAFTGNSFVTHNPDDGVIVPPGTDLVEVRLDNGSPTPLGLLYHGADTRTWTFMDATRIEGTTQVFEIEAERLMADGPYAVQSLWEFRVTASPEGLVEPYGGTYSLSAKAIKTEGGP